MLMHNARSVFFFLTFNIHSLPYKLVSDVDWDKYVECTDKNNVHDIWEWNNR
ncbi:13134_t:CDS:1, partial [Entrophospora sp. SA101]